MRSWIPLLVLCCLALPVVLFFNFPQPPAVFAQANQSSTTPDCQFSATINGVTASAAIPNSSATAGTPCVFWRITYTPNGFTGVTLAFQGARDVNGAAGTFTNVPSGNILEGTNPLTDFTCAPGGSGCTMVARIYTPWVRVNISVATGTGSIQVRAFGYRGTNPAATGGGVASAVTISGPLGQAAMAASIPVTIASDQSALSVQNLCGSQAEVALSGTGYTSIVAASGSTIIRLCKVFVTSASAGSPTVNTFTLAFGTCAGTPTEAMNAAGVTGLDSDFGGSLRGAASAAFCVKEATANSDKITVTYAQF